MNQFWSVPLQRTGHLTSPSLYLILPAAAPDRSSRQHACWMGGSANEIPAHSGAPLENARAPLALYAVFTVTQLSPNAQNFSSFWSG